TGSATFTMNRSSWAMKATAARTAMIHQRAGCPSSAGVPEAAAPAAGRRPAAGDAAASKPAASAFDIIPPGKAGCHNPGSFSALFTEVNHGNNDSVNELSR